LAWIKAIPAEKRRLKLLEDLYPALPQKMQEIVTDETGFTLASAVD